MYEAIIHIIIICLLYEKLERRLTKMHNNPFFAARVQKGYTQRKLSDETGLSQQLISKIENDTSFESYQFYTIKTLCNFLKVDIKKL